MGIIHRLRLVFEKIRAALWEPRPRLSAESIFFKSGPKLKLRNIHFMLKVHVFV
jgi:hypothetical protein